MGISSSLGMILKGLALGFSIAAPVGPIGVLCIRRTLANGFKSGLVSGAGRRHSGRVLRHHRGCRADIGG